jgi:hypothetical protein
MIRIDEIYQNTFLPCVENKTLHGLHWFDPFGSVAFGDLVSVPPVEWNDQSVRYLFWDQEPLYVETVDSTLTQFKKMYNGTHHIITSEKDSEFVDCVVKNYNLIPHYYFFHGWAALDWYRGYNRSFLMKPYRQRLISKTFIMPNRIIAGRRQHRLLMLYHIFKYQMTDNHISCPAVCPAENVSIQDAIIDLAKIYPDISEVFDRQIFPIEFQGESGAPMHSYQLSLFKESAESLLYLVAETVATGRRLHLTEKTFKPICLKMPFIIIGTAGSLRYLRSYGFRTFDSLWDESYDNEIHDDQRLEKIALLLKSIDILPTTEKQKLFAQAEEICEHNYRHFYQGGFETILWQELEGMLGEF